MDQHSSLAADERTYVGNMDHASRVDYQGSKRENSSSAPFQDNFTKSVCCVCLEGNERVFEKKIRTSDQVVRDVVYSCCVRAPPRLKVLANSVVLCS